MTLKERIAERIVSQQAEIDRMAEAQKTEMRVARDKLQALMKAQAALNPQCEAAITDLLAAGIAIEVK